MVPTALYSKSFRNKRKNGVYEHKKEKSFLFGNISSLSPFENFQDKEDISVDNLVSYL